MSTTTASAPMTKEERYANAIDRAKNYPMFGDGLTTPVAVGNISHYIATNGEERVIINLAMKTDRCVGGSRAHEHDRPSPNAHISQPAEWRIKFQTGEYVCALIENGYIKKLFPATTMQAKQITYNKPTTVPMPDGSAVDTETGEETAPPKASTKKPAAAAAAAADADNDLPF